LVICRFAENLWYSGGRGFVVETGPRRAAARFIGGIKEMYKAAKTGKEWEFD
jgi:hypothetical protein